MKRSDFLKGLGLVGAGSMIPFKGVAEELASSAKTTACPALIPSETAGPFPLDLTTNNAQTFFRNDVREDRNGVRLNLKMKILGADNCLPMNNVRVNIWHCDANGLYSGYNNQMNPGDVNATWLRGYQMTDANGEVDFTTIFPGWYNGRICHIHFQVYVSSVYAAVSQLSFDVAAKNALYAAYPSLYPNGADPMTFNSDNIFSDGYALQMATLTPDSVTSDTFNSYLEVTIQGAGTTGLAKLEPETGGQFKLGQNYPNPYQGTTTVPFTLTNPSDVKLELYDMTGRKVAEIKENGLSAGDHGIVVDMSYLGIASGNYLYQFQATNGNGLYRQCKMMTTIK